MPPKDPARTAAQRSTCLLLAEMAELMPGESITVRATDGYHEIETVIRPCRYSLADRPQQEQATGTAGDREQGIPASDRLTGMDRAILSVVGGEWRTATWVAHQLDREPDSYFRSRLRRLARDGRLEHDHRGYRMAK